MAEVKAKSVKLAALSEIDPEKEADRLAAKVCFYYQRYSLSEARRLPHRDVVLLLSVALRERAQEYFTLTQIAAAAHTQKKKGFKSLTDQFKKMMDS